MKRSQFDRVVLNDIPVMFVVERGLPSLAAPRAFQRLEATLPTRRGRRFYGVYDIRTQEYRACVALESGDDLETGGRTRGVIAGGTYLRALLRGPMEQVTARAAETFDAMAASAMPDPSRPAVEFYRRMDELILLFPIL